MAGDAQHVPLQRYLLWTAIALALGAGFAAAVVLGLALGGAVPIGPWWNGVVQAHGHAQLFGWAGLFVVGIGFFFFPRMRGAPLAFPRLGPWIAAAVGGGAALRFASQTALALGSPAGAAGAGLAASGVLQAAGAALVLACLAGTLRRGPPIRTRAGVPRVLPFLATAFLSFFAASITAGWLAFDAGLAGAAVVDPLGDRVVVELLLHGFLVAVALGVSVQTLPLFLRLPAAVTPVVQALGVLYAASVLARAGGSALEMETVSDAGTIAGALVVIAFVLWHDVVTRIRRPWTADRKPYELGERQPMRPGMPDRGEYGRFEWLVQGAYLWLVAGSVLDLLAASGRIGGGAPLVPPDAARHAFTMGFVTLLIVGMAVRMLPGFTKRRLTRPGAVAVLAVIGHAAALARVLPLLLPGAPGASAALAVSGALAWLTVLGLALVSYPLLRTRAPAG